MAMIQNHLRTTPRIVADNISDQCQVWSENYFSCTCQVSLSSAVDQFVYTLLHFTRRFVFRVNLEQMELFIRSSFFISRVYIFVSIIFQKRIALFGKISRHVLNLKCRCFDPK